jgi:SAM-dependent methyltransferase
MLSSRKYYDYLSLNYKNEFNKRINYINSINNLIFSNYKKFKFNNFLDIGIGDGLRFEIIKKKLKIKNFLLVEESGYFYEEIKKYFTKHRIINADFLKANIKKDSFTHVASLWNVLGHVKNRDFFFKKVNKILKINGFFIFDVNNRLNIKNYGLFLFLINLLKNIFSFRNSGYFKLQVYNKKTKVYIFTVKEIINLLEENGFKVEVIKYVDYLSGKIQPYQFFGQIFVIAKKIKS